MATSSVAAALALPEVVAAVDAFNELLPGVPASKENLQQLWNFLVEKIVLCGSFYAMMTDDCSIIFNIIERTRKNQDGTLHVSVSGPLERVGEREHDLRRAVVDCKRFPASPDGLAGALAWGKQMAQRVRGRDFCERCRVDGGRIPYKRLRAHPMPLCEGCTLEVSLGEPVAKRPRNAQMRVPSQDLRSSLP